MTTQMQIARDLVSRGFSVIPLEPAGKRPIAKWTLFQDAQPTEDNLRAWFDNDRDLNLGIITGRISSVVVVDIDSPAATAWAHSHLPPTPMRTRTAKGEHWYYQHPGVEVANRTRLRTEDDQIALDIRGDGGYVVAPGSLHETGVRYERIGEWPDVSNLPMFRPDWLVSVSRAATCPPTAHVAAENRATGDERLRQARNYVRAVEPAIEGQGGDHHTFGVCCRVARGFALTREEALEVLRPWNLTCQPPWLEAELAAKISNALNYGDEPIGGRLRTQPRPTLIAVPSENGQRLVPARNAAPAAGSSSWPAPIRPEAFRGPIGAFVGALEPETEADPAALLVQALVAFGNAAGRHAYFEAEGARHFLNLYAVLVGDSSKGRKGTSWSHTVRIFERADEGFADRTQGGLSSGEGLIFAVRDPVVRSEPTVSAGRRTGNYEDSTVDAGAADKRLLVVETEFANALRVMGRDGNTLSAVIREAWDSGRLSTLTKNNQTRATDAHISIIGHITADELRRYLTVTEAGNGFGNRFLWCCARRSKLLPEGGSFHLQDSSCHSQALRRALAFGHTCGELRRDPQARALWYERYAHLSRGHAGLLGAMVSRAEAQVMRLAAVYAVSEESAWIRLPHLRAALAVWDYCEASARHVFGEKLGDPDADEALAALRAAGIDGLTRTDITVSVFGRNRSSAQIGRVLDSLERGGLARKEAEPGAGRRPVERWFASSEPAQPSRAGSGSERQAA